MKNYILVLSDIEIACGVTLEQVQDVLPLVAVRNGKVMLPEATGPALAGAVARCALAGPVEFRGLNSLGYPVYGPAQSSR